MHKIRLENCIRNGQASECSMNDIYYSVLTLAATPFLTIPVLANVGGMDGSAIDEFLIHRKEEMVRILKARYSCSSK